MVLSPLNLRLEPVTNFTTFTTPCINDVLDLALSVAVSFAFGLASALAYSILHDISRIALTLTTATEPRTSSTKRLLNTAGLI